MKKLAVLGNSHVAALKDGWPPQTDAALHVHAEFFGCLKDGMKSFGLRGDGLMGPFDAEAARFFKGISTTGDFVEPDAYDAFLLAGMKFFPGTLIRNYASFACPDSRNQDTATQFVSTETLVAALWDELKDGMMMHVARSLRAQSDAPIFLMWQPFLSETLMQIEWRRDLYMPLLRNADGSFVRAVMDGIETHVRAEGFDVLRQPEETLCEGLMTAREWSDGSRQYRQGGGAEHRALDVFHMNAAFGSLCWTNWLETSALGDALEVDAQLIAQVA